MSHATFTFGRFNPPTESGHGKLVAAVQKHAEEKGGAHYIFPSHSQDPKKNPLSHKDKVGAMRKLFPGANVVSHPDVKNAIHALKHLESKGHTSATMIVGDDRVHEFHKLLHAYNGKDYKFKKIEVKSAGHRDPDAEGSEGMSASKLRGLVKAGKRDEFISHYSDKKLGAEIHDKVKANMSESKAMFILGGPGSGKDYVINNILKRYDLVEVQMDQILNGAVKPLIEQGADLLINGNADKDKITLVKSILENYSFAHTIVSVTNKVSRERNATRDRPLNEQVRIRKWLDCENISLPNSFIFKNSLNLAEASQNELKDFQGQIEEYLHFLQDNGFHTLAEVLEWGRDETVAAFKAATPGEGVDVKPKLTMKSLRKRGVKNMPPNAYDNRVGGVQYTNYAGGAAYTGGSFGGLVSHHVPEGNKLNEWGGSEDDEEYEYKKSTGQMFKNDDSQYGNPNRGDYRRVHNRHTGITHYQATSPKGMVAVFPTKELAMKHAGMKLRSEMISAASAARSARMAFERKQRIKKKKEALAKAATEKTKAPEGKK